MTVHIVYRSPATGPTGHHHATFADPTVLDWFRNHWEHLVHDEAWARLEELVGCAIYGFANCFAPELGAGGPAPASWEEVRGVLAGTYYNVLLAEPHAFQVLTDDDAIDLAYYLFDDVFLEQNGALAAFLLQGWELPVEAGAGGFEPAEPVPADLPAGSWEGTTYAVQVEAYNDMNLECMSESQRIDGVRLPQLGRYLARALLRPNAVWPFALLLLRAQLLAAGEGGEPAEEAFLQALRADPQDEVSWRAYSDWLQERGAPPGDIPLLERAMRWVSSRPADELHGIPHDLLLAAPGTGWKGAPAARPASGKETVQVAEHIAQVAHYDTGSRGKEDWHRWIFFDDLWASAHPDLANAMLRCGLRWDVLSPLGTPPRERDG